MFRNPLSRRAVITSLAATAASTLIPSSFAETAQSPLLKRNIPKTGEAIPVIGMGSWITFNVGDDQEARVVRTDVLRTFFDLGGGMIDSSPMYGSAEDVIGYCLRKLEYPKGLFSASKVWTPLTYYGKKQIENSHQLWGIERFDLLQVHNLVAWQAHLERLLQMKADNKLRYVGITTSHGLRHKEIEDIMKSQPIDFVQFTYNVLDREPEQRLLPLARERKIAVIVNRPFQRGDLFERFASKPLPDWITEFDCQNWAQFFLKFIVSHPDVTCAIPATSKVAHMKENMGAARGRLPSPEMRKKMIEYIRTV